MTDRRHALFFSLALTLVLLLSCGRGLVIGQESKASEQDKPLSYEKAGDWKPLFRGVEGLNLTVTSPRTMRAFAARIALETPGLEFVSTPENGEREREADGVTTSTFLKQQKCQLAINAGAFSPVTDTEGTGKDISGLHLSEGKVVSPWQDGYHAVVIGKENRARIIAEEEKDLRDVRTAVSGFQVNLWKGEVQKGDETIHPRTVLGLSKDGKWMYWMVIDGRQLGVSEGAKTREAAQLIKELGAEDAINLDGGGTSTLVMATEEGGAKVINRPIHRGIPGLERPGASHMGIKSERLVK